MVTKEQLRKAILDLKETKNVVITYFFKLWVDEYYRRWAIVIAWQDGFEDSNTTEYENGTYRICMKIGFQPTNSIMQEYDIDWTMPWDEETGDVDDSEITVYSDEAIDSCIDYIFGTWEHYKETYLDKEYLHW